MDDENDEWHLAQGPGSEQPFVHVMTAPRVRLTWWQRLKWRFMHLRNPFRRRKYEWVLKHKGKIYVHTVTEGTKRIE